MDARDDTTAARPPPQRMPPLLNLQLAGSACAGVPRFVSSSCNPATATATATATCSSTSTSAAAARVRSFKPQHRILLTLAHPSGHVSFAARRRLRSPYNWSHIVHHHLPSSASASTSTALESTAMATQTAQKRFHMGHSHGHGHHHHHDNTYLTSTNKSDPGVRITRIGLYVNLGMAVGKGVGGVVFNSQA